jgi:eukaryotic-like serine/threonine-protein kinase
LTFTPPRIAHYDIVRRLGHGGMGTVYLGRDPDLDRNVAIKVLREPLADGELLERFLREARATANLRHENLVTIYQVGEHDHQPFIAMEYVNGTTLAEIVKRRQALPMAQKLSYIEQMCAGLSYAHRAGIVHRDVKPANVMVDSEGVVRILDFGIARVTNSDMTSDGTVMGTLNYMSPEQMSGRLVDYRSDIFSVGALSYELLSYCQAFPGSPADGLLPRLLNEDPARLTEVCPGLPQDLEGIVFRALAKRPEDRFADLDDMRLAVRNAGRDIDPHLEIETVLVPSRVKPKPSTHPGSSGARRDSARTTRQDVADAEATLVREREHSELTPASTPSTSQGRSPGSRRYVIAAAAVAVLAIGGTVLWTLRSDDAGTPAAVTSSSGGGNPAAQNPLPPAAPAAAPVPAPAAVDPLAEPLNRIRQLLQAGDIAAALREIDSAGPSTDSRVIALARSAAQTASASMRAALAAARTQRAADLAPAAYASAEQAQRDAEDAAQRSDYVRSSRQALAAASAYRQAESQARTAAAAAATAIKPVPPPVSNATAPTPAASSTPPATPPSVRTETPASAPAPPAANPSSAATARPSALESERAGIMGALGRYQDAYRARSVDDLRKVYPNLPRETGQALERQLKNCRSFDVSFGNMQFLIAPDDPTVATVNVRTSYQCTPRSGQQGPASDSQDVFNLRKVQSQWVIETMNAVDSARRR